MTFDASKARAGAPAGAPARNVYDADVPPNLLQFMLKSWNPRAQAAESPAGRGSVSRAARAAVAALSRRDAGHPHRPREGARQRHLLPLPPGHRLLLPDRQPGARLRAGAACPRATRTSIVLFVEPNPGRTDATFFTDRAKGELWVGPRLGVAESRGPLRASTQAAAGAASRTLEAAAAAPASARACCAASPRLSKACWAVVPTSRRSATRSWQPRSPRCGSIKDADEIRELQSAVDATEARLRGRHRALKTAKSEREVEGVF